MSVSLVAVFYVPGVVKPCVLARAKHKAIHQHLKGVSVGNENVGDSEWFVEEAPGHLVANYATVDKERPLSLRLRGGLDTFQG